MILYIHGFNSSPASSKANLLRQKLELLGRDAEFSAPALPHRPAAAGDEALDYRRAVERYRGCRQIVVEGSDHGLSNFANYLDVVLEFCGAMTPRHRL